MRTSFLINNFEINDCTRYTILNLCIIYKKGHCFLIDLSFFESERLNRLTVITLCNTGN